MTGRVPAPEHRTPDRAGRRTVLGAAIAGAVVLGAGVIPVVASASTNTAFAAGDVVVHRVGDGSTSLAERQGRTGPGWPTPRPGRHRR
ncbi:hypothetical protein OG900_02060 [Streptomyces sp. NBC_00433]